MGMSNAERQRKFRSSWDEDETRRKYLQDSKEKYKKDKTLGKRKQITDMTQREKRHQRKIWRVQKRKLKERRKAEQERILTPPSSPVTPEKRQKRQIDDKQMDPYDRKKEFKTYLQKLAKCRTFCELQTECKQIDDKIGELTIDPHEYSEMFIPNEREMTNENIKSIYRKEILSITKDKSFMSIWQVHALSSVLKTPIQSVYPELGNRNVRKDMHKLIKPVSGTDKEPPVFVMWTSNRDDMTPLHWVPNHFVPLLKLPEWYKIDDENNNDLGVSDNYQTKQSRMERPIEVESSAHDISNATKVHRWERPMKSADGTECTFKEFMENSVDSLNIGLGKVDVANNGTESDSKDTSSKVDGSNGGTDSDKTDDDPKIDGAKEGTDSDNKDADVKVDGSNGGTESYSKDAVANDDQEQHETEHVNTDLNDHEGVSMGEKHGNKISDIDTNFDTCMYKEKHVLVNFNGKAHVGIVKETNLSSVLVDCMRRNGKKDKNSFCWPIKIRDTNWYRLTDVIAIVECSDIPGQRNRYQLDEKSWQMYSSHC
ncbi:hypothetical protein MAR_008366 [Mya arenaria]|uniref:Uncharacterized protein n=1 Tax=Mya arenaria TaxID=6604 RepID=A0ABY7DYX7_MYAAR|nr:hypothetical protein MAR_008366 [Mya arenaria]